MTEQDQQQSFAARAKTLVDWIAHYRWTLRRRPVRAQVAPGNVAAALPDHAPDEPESFDQLLRDLDAVIMPGITHWQHPRFFAYFPSNARPESQLAEMVISALGVNGMLWETSPAATELEDRMMDWLARLLDLPAEWHGVIQDTASTASFVAVLAALHRATGGRIREEGIAVTPQSYTIYTSAEAHSSIEKAAMMAGLGRRAVRKVPVDADGAMDPMALARMIREDEDDLCCPIMVVATCGTTGTGAFDPLKAIGVIARSAECYFHVDAAWAGSAMICPEYRSLMNGVEMADSFLFNPHKWMGVNFDCTAHFVRDPSELTGALSLTPAYLETDADAVVNYRDWGPQLGRRMRALKLWFTLRLVGAEGLRETIRAHVSYATRLAAEIRAADHVDLVTGPNLGLLTFRVRRAGDVPEDVDQRTEALLKAVNDDGFTYLTRTLVDGRPVIRWSIGAIDVTEEDVLAAWARVVELEAGL